MIRTAFVVALLSLSISICRAAMPREGTMEEFRPAATLIAKGVAKAMEARTDSSVEVEIFTAPVELGTASGPGLTLLIIQELQRLKVPMKPRSSLRLRGKYRPVKRPGEPPQTPQIQLEASLSDSSGTQEANLAACISIPEGAEEVVRKGKRGEITIDTLCSPEATAIALGLTADFYLIHQRLHGKPGEIDVKYEPFDLVQELLDKPTATIIDGTQLRSSSKSPYALQVLVKDVPKKLSLVEGQPVVELSKGESFRLRLINDAAHQVSATFAVDSVNTFAFAESKEQGRPRLLHWLGRPKSNLDVVGWYLNNSRTRDFQATDFSDAQSAWLASEGAVGTISVVVRTAWNKRDPPPVDEKFLAKQGTGTGRPNENPQIADELIVGRVRSVLTIHYTKPTE